VGKIASVFRLRSRCARSLVIKAFRLLASPAIRSHNSRPAGFCLFYRFQILYDNTQGFQAHAQQCELDDNQDNADTNSQNLRVALNRLT
jgi:hypothetical protein